MAAGDCTIFNPFQFSSTDEIDRVLHHAYFPFSDPRASGFEKTIDFMRAYQTMSDLATLFYSYIVTTCQTGNFLEYQAGRAYKDFRP